MKSLGKPWLARLDDANWILLFLGIGMIVFAVLVVPGSQGGAASLLIVMGAGLAVAAVLAAPFSELEIGPSGIKVTRDSVTSMPLPWLVAEAETLSQVAQVVLGNSQLTREVVEDAVSRVNKQRKNIPQSRVDLATFKTLVALLKRAENKRWFSGSRIDQSFDQIEGALRKLPLDARIAFALSLEFPTSEVAEILGRSEDEIATDVEVAKTAVAPYLGEEKGGVL
jgi:hypothetical protein